MKLTEEIKEWLAKADGGFNAALTLYNTRDKSMADFVCFHAQQAAEKYLKALLIKKKIAFPKIHMSQI